MKSRFVLLLLLMLVMVVPLHAQDNASHRVTVDGFSFDLALRPNVNIVPYVDDGMTFPPEADHIQFIVYESFPVPESIFDIGSGGIRLYNIAGLNELQLEQVQQLQTLLADRPDLSPYMTGDGISLPFLPMLTHGQPLRARAEYVETAQVSGISYLTVFSAAAEPFLSTSFLYTFQGLSADGEHYVSVLFPLQTSLFPAEPEPIEPDAFMSQLAEYMAETTAALTEASPDDFTPSLDALNALVESFAFEE